MAAQSNPFLDLYGDGTYDRGTLDEKMEQVNAQRRVVENRIKALDLRKKEAYKASHTIESIDAFCKRVGHGLEQMRFEDRQTFLRLVIVRAIINVNKTVCIEVSKPLGQPDPVFGLRTICPPHVSTRNTVSRLRLTLSLRRLFY